MYKHDTLYIYTHSVHNVYCIFDARCMYMYDAMHIETETPCGF